MTTDPDHALFEDLLLYLQLARGFDFTGYKRSSLMRRVKKRMQAHNIEGFGNYLDYVQVHPEEFLPLFNTILINVTGFFRDAAAWKYLHSQALPRLIGQKSAGSPIRVWSAGCASGEEAYTLAIILTELLGIEQFRQRVKIYATDVDDDALAQARRALYPAAAVQELSTDWRDRYFEVAKDGYNFRSDLRHGVIFGRHDLVQDAPISRLDLLVCRNVLMYFNAETQTKILDRFHFALNDTGLLFLGKAEMLLTHANLFTPISLQHRIFRRAPNSDRRERLLSAIQSREPAAYGITQSVVLREMVFETAPGAMLVVNPSGNLVMANAQARAMFNLNPLDQGRPLQDFEVSYRPLELRSPIERVCQERRPLTIAKVARPLADGAVQYLDVEIIPLISPEGTVLGASVGFFDVTAYHDLRAELQQTNHNLETANEELQSSNEELETTNEELQSTNEELETTNEELQSANEELETMNAELQSTNEELQTINEELRQRTGDFNGVNAFLQSILISLRVAVVVVDPQFNIVSWNSQAENLWGLRAAEVLAKSLFGLDIGLPVEQLRASILSCVNGATNLPELLLDATNRRGRAIRCRVSVNPLMDTDQTRQGAILFIEELEE